MRKSSETTMPAVAIAGCGAVTAVGRGVESLRSALRANASGLRACERFNHPRFQSSMVGEAPRSPTHDDPAWELASVAIHEAVAQAKHALTEVAPRRLGLVLSTTKANIEALERLAEKRACSEMAQRHARGDLLAADLAKAHGARGPVQCVSVACASGLIALQQGAKLMQRDAADAVLVVGVDHLSAFVMAGFTALKALDPQGCRPFDRDRCGLSPGEAGAAVILMRADKLPQPCVRIRGWGGSNDANHLTGPARDGSGLARAIRGALDSAQLQPGDIDAIHAHGTGTPYNDAMESTALRAVFNGHCPPGGASKGMLGHTLGAAGVVESILCVLAFEEKLVPGTPRLQVAAEGVPESFRREPTRASRLRNILKLNTGFGGTNAALILSHE